MIVYGLTMQEKPEQVPKEVATWLLERNSRYPNVDFTVECRDPHPSQVEEFVSMARKWSRVFSYSPPDYGIGAVSFLYLMQCWNVRIIGGLDEEGNIADRSKVEDIQPFSRELRAEIAGLPPDFERVGEGMIGIPRQDDDAPLEKPTEMISLPPIYSAPSSTPAFPAATIKSWFSMAAARSRTSAVSCPSSGGRPNVGVLYGIQMSSAPPRARAR